MKKLVCFLSVFISAVFTQIGFAAPLSGMVVVNQTSETAAKAKSEAINAARRQILQDVLLGYADQEALTTLLENTADSELVMLIAASSVSNEQISTDSYSATITMTLDNEIVKQWLMTNEVQNWVPNEENAEKHPLFILVKNGIADWAELKRLAREIGTDIEIRTIIGNQVFAQIPFNMRKNFTSIIKESDWKYNDKDGILQIWK